MIAFVAVSASFGAVLRINNLLDHYIATASFLASQFTIMSLDMYAWSMLKTLYVVM